MTDLPQIHGAQATAFAAAPHAGRFAAVMRHDWTDVTMLHFCVPRKQLQPHVPFELDTHPSAALGDDAAWLTLVHFTLRRMRCPRGEWLSRQLLRPISDHQFLNVRTYVRHRGEPGIYFLHEWLNNYLSVLLGPPTFGLPYCFARIRKQRVERSGLSLTFTRRSYDRPFAPAPASTIDAFLLERYTAFTQRAGRRRLFRIRHTPWPQRRVEARLADDALLRSLPCWPGDAMLALAHESPGVLGVEVSRPYAVDE